MKINLPPFLRNFWLILTEVPGWSDAPMSVRLLRTVPIALPCVGIALLLVWNLGWHVPEVHAERASHTSLLMLEAEIENLKLASSEQQTVELSARADQVSRLLVNTPEELALLFRSLKKEATDRGWDASVHPGELGAEPAVPGSQIRFLPVRVKFTPVAGHPEVYTSLLDLLERYSSTGKRMELTRMAIRADEHRWQSVEANYRVACSTAYEKTSQ